MARLGHSPTADSGTYFGHEKILWGTGRVVRDVPDRVLGGHHRRQRTFWQCVESWSLRVLWHSANGVCRISDLRHVGLCPGVRLSPRFKNRTLAPRTHAFAA